MGGGSGRCPDEIEEPAPGPRQCLSRPKEALRVSGASRRLEGLRTRRSASGALAYKEKLQALSAFRLIYQRTNCPERAPCDAV